MPFKIGGKGGGGSSLNVRNSHIFTSTLNRNNYFVTNPSELAEGVTVTTNGVLQKYITGVWTDISAVIKGQTGDNAPNTILQFSTDGTTGWSDTLNPSIHLYWRWSTDNGVTWSPDSIPYRAATGGGAGLTPQQEADLTDNTAARHGHTNKAILDATTGTFTLARQTKLDGVQDTWKGSFADAAELNTTYPTPTNNWSALNRATGTVWSVVGGLWVDTGASSLGDMAAVVYDPQGVAADAFLMSNMLESDTSKIMTGAERIKLSGLADITSIGTHLTLSSGELNVKDSTLATFAETAIYDPTGVEGDAFRMDNMVEGTNTKILTDAERTKLTGLVNVKSIGGGLSIDLAGDLTASASAPDLTPYMDKATYDVGGVGLDSFNMDNMVEGANTKILTSAERTSIADIPNKQAVISETNRLPVNLVGDGNKVLSENDFTASLASKLANIEDRFLGIFADSAARDLAYPTPLNGQYCKQSDTNSFWFYGAGVWTDTGSSSTGDMLASLYDPQGVAADAFNLDNMVDSANFVKMTPDERTKLANSSQLTTAERALIPTQAEKDRIPTQAEKDKLTALPTRTALTSEIAAKQTKLVSGSTIRTINGSTLLGSGNLAISTTITGVAYNSSTDKVVISKNMDINMFVVFDDPASSSKMTVTWENDTTTPSRRNLVFTPTNNASVEMTDLYVRGSIDTGNLWATGNVYAAGEFKSLGANIGFKNASNAGWYSSGSGGFRPYSNGTQDIGQSSLRVRSIYTVNSVDVSSDERYKHFGEEVDHKLLRNLSGKHYTWKAGSPAEYQEDIGFSAQEVAKVLPELVNYDVASDFYSMSYERLVVPLVNYCNAQQEELDDLKARLDKLTEVKEKKKRWYYLWLI